MLRSLLEGAGATAIRGSPTRAKTDILKKRSASPDYPEVAGKRKEKSQTHRRNRPNEGRRGWGGRGDRMVDEH
jgi:hypothetical protein